LNKKLWREDISKPTIWSGKLHEDNNDKGVRIVNYTSSKKFVRS